MNIGRRHVLRGALHGAAGVALTAFAPPLSMPVSAQGGPGRGGATAPAAQTGTRLVLLGTQGGPNVTLRRSQAGCAIVVDGRPYLVDCGYGTLRALVESGVGYLQVGAVFLTHLHDDHTSDLPALLTHQWTGSRAQPTTVYGPHGTAALVSAAVAFLKPNAEIRMVDEGRTSPPEALFRGHDVAAAAPAQAFSDERLKVTSVENSHYKEGAKAAMPHRSLAYRFDTPARSIVVSGDTAYSEALVALARGADLFVCEAMELSFYEAMMAQAKAAAAKGNTNSIARHVAETHSTTVDVGRMAAEAKVKTVVLTHIVPGSRPGSAELPETIYIDGVRQHFSGQVIVGRDQMVL
jgi:ribonuclease BN (tRNA processing enzyme)